MKKNPNNLGNQMEVKFVKRLEKITKIKFRIILIIALFNLNNKDI